MADTSEELMQTAQWFFSKGCAVFPSYRNLKCVPKVRSERLADGKIPVDPEVLLNEFVAVYHTQPEAWCLLCDGTVVAIDAERNDIAEWLIERFPSARVEKGSKGAHLFFILTDEPIKTRGQAKAKDGSLACEVLANWSCVLAGSKHRSKDILYTLIREGEIIKITHADLESMLGEMGKEFDIVWGAAAREENKLPSQDKLEKKIPSEFWDIIAKGVDKNRNEERFKLGMGLIAVGLDQEELVQALLLFNSNCKPKDAIGKVNEHARQIYSNAEKGKLHISMANRQKDPQLRMFADASNPQNPQRSAIRVFYDGVPQEPQSPATTIRKPSPPLGGADAVEVQTDTRTSISLHSLGKLLETQGTAQKWVLPGIIPESALGMIAAKRASHKTFFALHVGISAASGTPNVLGEPEAPCSVLYLDMENGDFEIKRRCAGIVATLDPEARKLAEKNFHLAIFPRLSIDPDSDGEEKLRAIIQAVSPKLVIVDVMRRLTSGEENSSGTSNEMLGALQRAMKDFGCSFLLLHHMRKGSANMPVDDELDEIRGSSDIVASVAVCLKLARIAQSDRFVVKQLKNRYAPERSAIQIHIEGTAPDAIKFIYDGEISDAAAIENALARKIHEWLICERKFEFQTKEVKARFVGAPPAKSSERSVEDAISVLRQLEKIEFVKKGHYSLKLPGSQAQLAKEYPAIGREEEAI